MAAGPACPVSLVRREEMKTTSKEMEIIRLRRGSAKIAFIGSRIKIDSET